MTNGKTLNIIKELVESLIEDENAKSAKLKVMQSYSHYDPINIGISAAMKIRTERRSMYGDKFLDDTDEFLVDQIANKLKRFKDSNKDAFYDNAIDSATDLAVYSLFLLTKQILKDDNEIVK